MTKTAQQFQISRAAQLALETLSQVHAARREWAQAAACTRAALALHQRDMKTCGIPTTTFKEKAL